MQYTSLAKRAPLDASVVQITYSRVKHGVWWKNVEENKP